MAKKKKKLSPSAEARQFFQTLGKASAPAAVYHLFGEEAYLLGLAVEAVIKLAAPEGLTDFNHDTFQGKQTTGGPLRAAVETLPFMCARRIVLVRDLQEVETKHLSDLEDYLLDPSPSTCLILHEMTVQKKVDRRSKFLKKLSKVAVQAEFRPFYENEVDQFIQRHAAGRGLKLDEEACAYLTRAVGTDLGQLILALEKIDLYLGQGEPVRQVDRASISALIAETKADTIFDLTDALGDRRTEDAVKILDRMLISGEAPILISFMIARHFRILAKLMDPSLRQADRHEKAKAVGVSPFFLKDYERHARTFGLSQVESVLDRLVSVDQALKSSRLGDRLILEHLLLDVMLGQGQARA